MKILIALILPFVLALSTKAQVSKSNVNEHYIILGIDSLSNSVKDALFQAHVERSRNQIALVAGKNFMSTYYAVYDSGGRLVGKGKFAKKRAGDFDIVDLGTLPRNYRIVFSPLPVLAKN